MAPGRGGRRRRAICVWPRRLSGIEARGEKDVKSGQLQLDGACFPHPRSDYLRVREVGNVVLLSGSWPSFEFERRPVGGGPWQAPIRVARSMSGPLETIQDARVLWEPVRGSVPLALCRRESMSLLALRQDPVFSKASETALTNVTTL